MRLTRIQAGLYETPDGHKVEQIEQADGSTEGWHITCPGRAFADEWVWTLRDVRAIDFTECGCHQKED